MADAETVNVRYLVDDVAASVDFYTRHFGFTVGINSPAFADVTEATCACCCRARMSSAGKPMADGERPGPGGWNRIHLIVDDVDREVARLSDEGVTFRNEIVTGPGGAQVLAVDPSGNLVELFQPAGIMITPGIDHIALTVPDLDAQVDRLTSAFGMVVEGRTEHFALIADPASGLKIELGRSDDADVHFRHFGFRADDVDAAHEDLVARRHGVERGAAPTRLRPHVHVVPHATGRRRGPAREVRRRQPLIPDGRRRS